MQHTTHVAAQETGGPQFHSSLVDNPMMGTDADPAHIRHLVVIGHPAPDSFNHAIARAYCDAVSDCGETAVLRDLYATGFDPLLKAHERPGTPGFRLSADVEEELALVERASAIVLVYPIWFGMPPAVITGYVDRVLGAGLSARAIRQNEPHDLLLDKQLVLLTTSGSTLPWLAERGQWHGMREAFDFYLQSIFSFADSTHEHFDSVVSPLSSIYADECLGRVVESARTICSTLLSDAHERQKHAALSLRQESTGDVKNGARRDS
ncbi:MAG: NAD(P)H-dependent oxidoreductase [Candidatus Sphingomonas colombiensis]|nr:NAD(P)H-dependent oxidoreductase [Sphingomonas sp.]WEK43220.1 MAG: NAD(P)H-dependent oxidoreductase [Sphingomonas sp.]